MRCIAANKDHFSKKNATFYAPLAIVQCPQEIDVESRFKPRWPF